MPYFRSKEDKFNSDVTIIPDYLFRDINTKCTFRNDQYLFIRLSMMSGQDRFSYLVDDMLTRWLHIRRNTSEYSLQKGASLVIEKMTTFQQLNLKTKQCEAVAL